MKSSRRICLAVFAALFLIAMVHGQATQKDYLTALEADKIRDAETPNDKIKLFIQYADDRLKKFQYELDHPSANRHAEMLNYLMNSYIGCVDDASDLIQEGIEKQQNVRAGVDLMAKKAAEFLEILKKISADGKEIDTYKFNLDDAIDGTQDAIRDAEKAKKNVAPPPVRRRNQNCFRFFSVISASSA